MVNILMTIVCSLLIGSLTVFMIGMCLMLFVGAYEIYTGRYKTQQELFLEHLREV